MRLYEYRYITPPLAQRRNKRYPCARFHPTGVPMHAILIIAFLVVCILIPRYYANYPWAWAISLTIWLTVVRAHFIFFLALWLVCWAAREKIWRDTYLIVPIENMVKRILH
jgi:cardiolipin synthetase